MESQLEFEPTNRLVRSGGDPFSGTALRGSRSHPLQEEMPACHREAIRLRIGPPRTGQCLHRQPGPSGLFASPVRMPSSHPTNRESITAVCPAKTRACQTLPKAAYWLPAGPGPVHSSHCSEFLHPGGKLPPQAAEEVAESTRTRPGTSESLTWKLVLAHSISFFLLVYLSPSFPL